MPPSADQPPWQPPLTRWAHLWRTVGALLLSLVVWWPLVDDQWALDRTLFWIDVLVGAAAFPVMLLRRRHPFLVAAVLSVACAVSAVAAGPALVAAVSLATLRRYGQVVLVGILQALGAQVVVALQPVPPDEPFWLSTTVNVVATTAVLAIGMYIGSRRELLWTLRDRAVRAEAEQALRVAQARATERERIAREMHDVLGHRISLVTLHAGALAYRTDLDRAEVGTSARVIQDNAQQAMAELRTVLGVLRGTDGQPSPSAPLPTLRDVPALVDEAVASGMRVDLDVRVAHAEDLSDALGCTVYRVVQEGLTNARRHADGSRVSVTVSGCPDDGVTVRLANPLPLGASTAGQPGFGLIGLAERAELAGGTLTWRREDRSFVMEAGLPWRSPA